VNIYYDSLKYCHWIYSYSYTTKTISCSKEHLWIKN